MRSVNLRLKRKMNEVFSIEPNELGVNFLTSYFKKLTAYLKVTPFVYIIPLTFIISIFLYFVLGRFLIKLVTVLQYGF
ncbi:MAG: hypothetical protein ACD_12C00603G0001 [uncultured bacterium]|nr:MAG: hypothetical protein ACD_12C00603G0001 [uncultured bacterium]